MPRRKVGGEEWRMGGVVVTLHGSLKEREAGAGRTRRETHKSGGRSLSLLETDFTGSLVGLRPLQ